MYTFLKTTGFRKFLSAESPPLVLALLLSELLYRLGSFLLECAAFMVTWYVLGFVFSMVRHHWFGRKKKYLA